MFALFFGAGIAINVLGPTFGIGAADPPISRETSMPHFTSDAVRRIESSEEFRAAIAVGRCVLFVNCEWNPHVIIFRQLFSEFADWCERNTDYETLSVLVSEDELTDTIESLWQANSIPQGGMKNQSGAGRIVWFSDGHVVDYAWCMDIKSLDGLTARTMLAFE